MNEKTLNRIGYTVVFILGFFIIAAFVLVGWGFVEIIQWLTSK
jgi:hypothetical protein